MNQRLCLRRQSLLANRLDSATPASAQAAYRSLRRERQSSFIPLCFLSDGRSLRWIAHRFPATGGARKRPPAGELPTAYKPVRLYCLPLRGRHARWSCPTTHLSHPRRRARRLGAPVQERPSPHKLVRLYRLPLRGRHARWSAQRFPTKEPYGCGVPLAGACPTNPILTV